MRTKILFAVCVLLFDINLIMLQQKSRAFEKWNPIPPLVMPHSPVAPEPDPEPEVTPHLSFTVPKGDMSFPQIVSQLKKWNKEAPKITEFGTYGRTQNGTEIPYLRIGKKTGPKVLITSSIHGNEHLCAMTTMGVMGTFISSYNVDKEITKLLQERDVYYVPVISPESFIRNQRYDLGLDPNRNWNNPNLQERNSIPSIQALKDFHTKEKFKAMMSCHNYGKVYLHPWGYSRIRSGNDADFKRILGAMSRETGYGVEQTYRQSAPPYYGYEADWFLKHGALAFVNEIGTRFVAIRGEIEHEVDVNLKAFKIWIREAPLVKVPYETLIQDRT